MKYSEPVQTAVVPGVHWVVNIRLVSSSSDRKLEFSSKITSVLLLLLLLEEEEFSLTFLLKNNLLLFIPLSNK